MITITISLRVVLILLIRKWASKAKSPKWKMVAFYYILDTVRINATTAMALNQEKNPKSIKSFDIGWDLAMSLILPHIQCRSFNGLTVPIQHKVNTVLGKEALPTPAISDQYPKQGESRKR